MIVTNTTVRPLYAVGAEEAPGRHDSTRCMCSSCRTARPTRTGPRSTWSSMRCSGHGSDRKTVLFALGGGVVGDLTRVSRRRATCAACRSSRCRRRCWRRSTRRWAARPAINHPLGKNMIGAFYQPRLVLCDLGTLGDAAGARTPRGPGGGHQVRADLRRRPSSTGSRPTSALRARDPAALAHAVRALLRDQGGGRRRRTSARRAARHPELRPHLRPRDRDGARATASWLHGEAVGCGMVMAAAAVAAAGWRRRSLRAAAERADRGGRPADPWRRASAPSATSS